MTLMEENIALNDVDSHSTGSISVEAKVLNWEQPLPAFIEEEGFWPDLVM